MGRGGVDGGVARSRLASGEELQRARRGVYGWGRTKQQPPLKCFPLKMAYLQQEMGKAQLKAARSAQRRTEGESEFDGVTQGQAGRSTGAGGAHIDSGSFLTATPSPLSMR